MFSNALAGLLPDLALRDRSTTEQPGWLGSGLRVECRNVPSLEVMPAERAARRGLQM